MRNRLLLASLASVLAAQSFSSSFTGWTFELLPTGLGPAEFRSLGDSMGAGFAGVSAAIYDGSAWLAIPGSPTGEVWAAYRSQIGSPSPTGLLQYFAGVVGSNIGTFNPTTGAFTVLRSGSPAVISANENGWCDSSSNTLRPWTGPTVTLPAAPWFLSGIYMAANPANRAAIMNANGGMTTRLSAFDADFVTANAGVFMAGSVTDGGVNYPASWGPTTNGIKNNRLASDDFFADSFALASRYITGYAGGPSGTRAALWDNATGAGSEILHQLTGKTRSVALGMRIFDDRIEIYGNAGPSVSAEACKWVKPIVHEPYMPSSNTNFSAGQSFVPGNLVGQQGFTHFNAPSAFTVQHNVALGLNSVVRWNPASAAAGDGFAYVPRSFTPTVANPRFVASTRMFVRSKGGGSFGHNSGGLAIYNGGTEYARVLISANGTITLGTNSTAAQTAEFIVASPDNWHNVDLVLDFSDSTVKLRVNGTYVSGAAFTPGASPVVSDADLLVNKNGTEEIYFSNIKMGLDSPKRIISGKVKLEDFPVPGSGYNLEIYSGSTLVSSQGITGKPDGGFEVAVPIGSGNYTARARAFGFLARRVAFTVDQFTNSTIDLSLPNGDIILDGVIDLSDYTKVAVFFNKTSSDPDWNTQDGDGISPAFSDLNIDGVIDLTDYTIIAINFNKLSDPTP